MTDSDDDTSAAQVADPTTDLQVERALLEDGRQLLLYTWDSST